MKTCDHCFGQGMRRRSVSALTGQVFHSICHNCGGRGHIPDDRVPEEPAASERLRRVHERLARDSMEYGLSSGVGSTARGLAPRAFRR